MDLAIETFIAVVAGCAGLGFFVGALTGVLTLLHYIWGLLFGPMNRKDDE